MPTAEEIEANAATYQEQAFKILDREKTEVRRNSEWLRMEPEALLGLLAQTTVARLLERDDFQKRMGAGPADRGAGAALPAAAGLRLGRVEADVELGGTDQKFNLLFGRDIQTAYGQQPQSIMTLPILVGTDGVQKMSKSLGNYVGVTDPPEEMFGKLMSIPDEAMDEYYRLLLGQERPEAPPNQAKRELGRRIVDRFHGEGAGATAAEEHFNRVFVQHAVPEDIPEVELGAYRADGNGRGPPAAPDRRRLRRQHQRGPAPDPAGRGQARRRAGARAASRRRPASRVLPVRCCRSGSGASVGL